MLVGVAVKVGVGVRVLVGVGDGVKVRVGVGVAVNVGVGVGHRTSTESLDHVLNISTDSLSKIMCSPVKFRETLPQFTHDTLKSITARVPLPLTPKAPTTLLIIRTVPCIPAGMNPQSLTVTTVPPMSPSLTPVTCKMSGSYVMS